MANSDSPKASGDALEQDPLVNLLRPDPSAAPLASLVLEGLAGRSNREGYSRIYFNAALNYYAEFASADLVFSEAIPPEQPPFLGHKATRVGIREDAVVDYTRTARAKGSDPFAADVRNVPSRQSAATFAPGPATWEAECPGNTFYGCGGETLGCGTQRTQCVCPTDNTCRTDCGQATCDTCRTDCDQATCVTCRTCGQATCQTCNQATCQTCNQATCNTCNQATCNTCATACNQATCNTCKTDCGGRTCVTCDTCNPHVFTCGNQRGCQ